MILLKISRGSIAICLILFDYFYRNSNLQVELTHSQLMQSIKKHAANAYPRLRTSTFLMVSVFSGENTGSTLPFCGSLGGGTGGGGGGGVNSGASSSSLESSLHASLEVKRGC